MVTEGAPARLLRVWDWTGSSSSSSTWNAGVVFGVTAVTGLTIAVVILMSSRRGGLKSPWSRGKRKRPLSRQQWINSFLPDGRLRDGGLKFLKKARAEYDLGSSEAERRNARTRQKEEYEQLRKQCLKLLRDIHEDGAEFQKKDKASEVGSRSLNEGDESLASEDVSSSNQSLSVERSGGEICCDDALEDPIEATTDAQGEYDSGVNHLNSSRGESESSDSDSSDEESESTLTSADTRETITQENKSAENTPSKGNLPTSTKTAEDFTTWQRIIRLDAIRANDEWIHYSPIQAAVPEHRAHQLAVAVGLKDYEHLEHCRIYHAARLVAVLEAYALYDPDIGYCQGMSDLLSPILAVMEEDHDAFWCFVGFMRKARHNFRLDEVGIHRQLGMVSKIIKYKDSHLYRHLQKLQADDCFFVYRMVVVMFRRELSFEQTLLLWEVVWADQAAVRAGFGKSAWGRTKLWETPPPTDDLLLYAIAASVLQRRKLIIERYSSMDEILRECNSMAGKLDVWKLLDDAHNLVATLQDRI